jgi:uncharacterized protein YjiS (DUF1127 family)
MLAITPSFSRLRLPRFVLWAAELLARMTRRANGLALAWMRRRETVMLARADDHILADLGLSRGDLADAFSGPPWEDPTLILRSRALERRLARHRSATLGFPLPGERLTQRPEM